MVWSANIYVFTCMPPIHSESCGYVIQSRIHYKQSTHPIHHSQVHTHFKCLGGMEVDPLGQVGEKLVVKRLHPVGVSTLEEQIYINEHDMYCPCCIQDEWIRMRLFLSASSICPNGCGHSERLPCWNITWLLTRTLRKATVVITLT